MAFKWAVGSFAGCANLAPPGAAGHRYADRHTDIAT